MSFLDFFRPLKPKAQIEKWKELGSYQAQFTAFGTDAYRSALVRSCIRPLAEYSAKAEAKCNDKRLERILNNHPNMYMNGHDFLYKVRTRLELLNSAFIYLERNDKGQVIGLYPVPYSYFEAIEYQNGLFIKFYFNGDAARTMTLAWADLCVIRKDYNESDISGDDNGAILDTLKLLQTANEGLANSIKSTANLRGILKSTKAMLASDAIKAQRDQFVADYMSLENNGGIASLDSTQEFTPITMSPLTATYEQMKEIRENIYRFYGVNDDIIMGNVKTEQLENFYKLKIQPFLISLSRELTAKIFAGKSGAYEGNYITYMSESGEFMTMSQKLDFFNKVVLYGGATINEWRHMLGLGSIDGGDVPIRRLDADYINLDESPREGNGSSGSNESEVSNEDGKDE